MVPKQFVRHFLEETVSGCRHDLDIKQLAPETKTTMDMRSGAKDALKGDGKHSQDLPRNGKRAICDSAGGYVGKKGRKGA